MKNIEIDDNLYQHIVANTQSIGESASSILRRLLSLEDIDEKNDKLNNTPNDKAVTSEKVQPEKSETKKSTTSISAKSQEKKSTSSKVAIIDVESANTVQSISNESVFNYINKEELATKRGAVGRFLSILAALHRVHPNDFNVVNDIRGRDRLYFANSETELAASGSSTNPRIIPDSSYWVITNTNTTRKKMMLTEVAIGLGYSMSDAETIRELL
jgi:negative modulator of initiation of replication